MGVPERLVEVRERYGYTRKRLADELAKPYRTITKYETGEREPGHSYIVEISKKFGVSTDYILGVSDSMAPSAKKELPTVSDEELLDEELIRRLCQLSPEELEKVDAFVQGLLAAR